MPTYYEVKQGDCISSIAFDYGFFPDTVWNHPGNAELKNKRKDPNTLCPGDVVVVPDKREKIITKPTGEMHKFRLNNTPALCSLQIFDQDDYRANQKYELEVDGVIYKGTTTSDGVLRVGIPPNAKTGKLTIGEGEDKAEFNLQFGFIEPPTETRGVQARLQNLGYDCRINGRLDDDTRRALREFQFANGLPETGEIDQATRQKLDDLHDTVCDIPNRDEVKKDDDQNQADNEIETPFEEENFEDESQDENDSQNEMSDSKDDELENESEYDELETEDEKSESENEDNSQNELKDSENDSDDSNQESESESNEAENDEAKKENQTQPDNENESASQEEEKPEDESEDDNDSQNELNDSKDNESENDESEEDMKQ